MISFGGLVSPELLRAYLRYFRQKESPRIATDVLGVVVLDDNSKGPYPPYKVWYWGGSLASIAGEYTYAYVSNEDGVQGQVSPTGIGKSALVVDSIDVSSGTLDAAFVITISRKGSINPAATQAVNSASEEGGDTATNRAFGNVRGNLVSQVGFLGAAGDQLFPMQAVRWVHHIEGPWIVGPQGVVTITTINPAAGIVNNNLTAYFRGRYYPAT